MTNRLFDFMAERKSTCLGEQVLILFRDILWRNEVRKYDLIVAFVEHYSVSVSFGCVGKKDYR